MIVFPLPPSLIVKKVYHQFTDLSSTYIITTLFIGRGNEKHLTIDHQKTVRLNILYDRSFP